VCFEVLFASPRELFLSPPSSPFWSCGWGPQWGCWILTHGKLAEVGRPRKHPGARRLQVTPAGSCLFLANTVTLW
jgi:hypothetical protein